MQYSTCLTKSIHKVPPEHFFIGRGFMNAVYMRSHDSFQTERTQTGEEAQFDYSSQTFHVCHIYIYIYAYIDPPKSPQCKHIWQSQTGRAWGLCCRSVPRLSVSGSFLAPLRPSAHPQQRLHRAPAIAGPALPDGAQRARRGTRTSARGARTPRGSQWSRGGGGGRSRAATGSLLGKK